MSRLNPAGQRAGQVGRIFGATPIEQHCKQALKDRDGIARTSIATANRHGGEHQNSREIQRRLRRQKRQSA